MKKEYRKPEIFSENISTAFASNCTLDYSEGPGPAEQFGEGCNPTDCPPIDAYAP